MRGEDPPGEGLAEQETELQDPVAPASSSTSTESGESAVATTSP
jgi:hypothetical protein